MLKCICPNFKMYLSKAKKWFVVFQEQVLQNGSTEYVPIVKAHNYQAKRQRLRKGYDWGRDCEKTSSFALLLLLLLRDN